MKTANLITLLRLVLLPFYLWSLQNLEMLAAVIFSIIILTDLADGRIARRLHQETEKGQVFDSIVDYLVVNISFIWLFALNILSTNLFVYIMMGSLLLLIVQGLIWKANRKFVIPNSTIGKCRGTFEYVLILLATVDWTVGSITLTGFLVSTTTFILVPLIFFHSWKMVHMAALHSKT